MNTFERLKNTLSEVFGDDIDVSKITEVSDLKADLGMNSIGMLYVALAIENEFGKKLTNDDFADIKTVADVIGKIEG
ncbi:MAG: acyl carrier protein [Clostridiales bacterium]|nr:acyl carrier protein [Candidatus Coliplasma equi]